MITLVQRLGDQLLSRLVPSATANACTRPTRVSRTCVSCPGAAGYLFRIREVWSCCGGLATECTYYSSCNRTC